jgi:hypothetical protein
VLPLDHLERGAQIVQESHEKILAAGPMSIFSSLSAVMTGSEINGARVRTGTPQMSSRIGVRGGG